MWGQALFNVLMHKEGKNESEAYSFIVGDVVLCLTINCKWKRLTDRKIRN